MSGPHKHTQGLWVALGLGVILGCPSCTTLRSVLPEPLSEVLRPPQAPQLVRVALLRNAPSARLKVTGPGLIYDAARRRPIRSFTTLSDAIFTADARGVLLAGVPLGTSRVAILPDMPRTLWINGVFYRGDALIIAGNPGSLTVVNSLPLEDYLMGVVPKETFPSWPEEALRAQAVVSRSFAVYHIRHAGAAEYDLVAPSHQLYGGAAAEDPRTTKAVLDTEGEVLWYDGDILCTFFHTACGGRTEEASNVFARVKTYPPAVFSPYEADSPYHAWRYSIALVNCAEKLRRAGKWPGGPIRSVTVLQRFPSGRVAQLRFAGRDTSVVVTGEEVRRILGYDAVRSTWFNVGIRGERLEFAGRGWGHGVGLCQWSSKGMADRGFDYQRILAYFYPGSTLHLSLIH
ncbi:MAG: SpoIID/LytB domain-containing protein, partial [bacterium]|nr:SpoIID/LytB domain-containing protein [bacterium]